MSEQITIREAFKRHIKSQQQALRATHARLRTLEKYAPEILDLVTNLSFDSQPVYGNWINIEDHDYVCPEAGVILLRLSGKDRLPLLRYNNKYEAIKRFHSGKYGYFKFTLRRKEKKPCRKARVTETRVIEVCGGLDESRYDNVAWLEDDD